MVVFKVVGDELSRDQLQAVGICTSASPSYSQAKGHTMTRPQLAQLAQGIVRKVQQHSAMRAKHAGDPEQHHNSTTAVIEQA